MPEAIEVYLRNLGQAYPNVQALWQIKIAGKWSHIPKSNSCNIALVTHKNKKKTELKGMLAKRTKVKRKNLDYKV